MESSVIITAVAIAAIEDIWSQCNHFKDCNNISETITVMVINLGAKTGKTEC